MKYIKEFLLESDEYLRDLMRDLETMGYEDLYSVRISGEMVKDFGEGSYPFRVSSHGEGKSKEEALLRAISVAIQSIERGGKLELLRRGKEIDIEYEVLRKGIVDGKIAVEEIGYESVTDVSLTVEDLPSPQFSAKDDIVGMGWAREIKEWE